MSDLEPLAWEAVVTPSLGAHAALDVLADALLERGAIREPWKPVKRSGLATKTAARSAKRSRRYVLGAAFEWAKRAVLPRVTVHGTDGFVAGMIVKVTSLDGRSYEAVAELASDSPSGGEP